MCHQVLGTKNEAKYVVKKLIKNDESRLTLVPSKKYNANAKVRSLQYNQYYVLCHANSVR